MSFAAGAAGGAAAYSIMRSLTRSHHHRPGGYYGPGYGGPFTLVAFSSFVKSFLLVDFRWRDVCQ